MKTEHTEGEWMANLTQDDRDDPGFEIYDKENKNFICYFDPPRIVLSTRNQMTKEEIEANAKLIAAAPDSHNANLLSLEVLSTIESQIQNEQPISVYVIKTISDAIKANSEAIKKATK